VAKRPANGGINLAPSGPANGGIRILPCPPFKKNKMYFVYILKSFKSNPYITEKATFGSVAFLY